MEKKTKLGLIATILGSITNLVLALVKLFVGIVTNSISVFFDAVNNFLDIIASVLGAVGIGVSTKGPTKEYPNGFGRMEYIITFVISTLTLSMGGMFIFYSVERLLYPLPVFFSWVYFGILIITLLVKIFMAIGYYFLHKKDNSDISKALYIDSVMDSVITGSTVLCYGLCFVTNTVIDAILGIVIGIFVLMSAIKMVIGAVKNLLGYNIDLDTEELKSEITSKGIFTDVTMLKINDYGKQNRELLIAGKLNEDKMYLLKEIEKDNNIKIFVVKE